VIIIHSITNDHPVARSTSDRMGISMSGWELGSADRPIGQCPELSLLQGKILRIDVDHPDPGKDIPYRKTTRLSASRAFARDLELRAPGSLALRLRSSDARSVEGDVGQISTKNEYLAKGRNYGWNVYEDSSALQQVSPRRRASMFRPSSRTRRKYGQSVTGGYVYRGNPKSSFYGVYIFGDYQQKRLFAMTQRDRLLDESSGADENPQSVVSLGQDAHGNNHFVGYEGNIYKLDLESSRFE